MAYLKAEVDLDDLDINDVIEWIKKLKHRSGIYSENKFSRLKTAIGHVLRDAGPANLSKVDQWKNELWPALKEKFSLEQHEQILNN